MPTNLLSFATSQNPLGSFTSNYFPSYMYSLNSVGSVSLRSRFARRTHGRTSFEPLLNWPTFLFRARTTWGSPTTSSQWWTPSSAQTTALCSTIGWVRLDLFQDIKLRFCSKFISTWATFNVVAILIGISIGKYFLNYPPIYWMCVGCWFIDLGHVYLFFVKTMCGH